VAPLEIYLYLSVFQRLKVWGAFEELQALKRVPDVTAGAFKAVDLSSGIKLTSHAWNISLDPKSGCVPPFLK
jgi:hypothetical protein